jgi:hypothetical protein
MLHFYEWAVRPRGLLSGASARSKDRHCSWPVNSRRQGVMCFLDPHWWTHTPLGSVPVNDSTLADGMTWRTIGPDGSPISLFVN